MAFAIRRSDSMEQNVSCLSFRPVSEAQSGEMKLLDSIEFITLLEIDFMIDFTSTRFRGGRILELLCS